MARNTPESSRVSRKRDTRDEDTEEIQHESARPAKAARIDDGLELYPDMDGYGAHCTQTSLQHFMPDQLLPQFPCQVDPEEMQDENERPAKMAKMDDGLVLYPDMDGYGAHYTQQSLQHFLPQQLLPQFPFSPPHHLRRSISDPSVSHHSNSYRTFLHPATLCFNHRVKQRYSLHKPTYSGILPVSLLEDRD